MILVYVNNLCKTYIAPSYGENGKVTLRGNAASLRLSLLYSCDVGRNRRTRIFQMSALASTNICWMSIGILRSSQSTPSKKRYVYFI